MFKKTHHWLYIKDIHPRPEARDVIATPNNATHSVCANATMTKPKAAKTQEIITRILKHKKKINNHKNNAEDKIIITLHRKEEMVKYSWYTVME